MAKRKISVAEYEGAHKHFLAAIKRELPARGLARLRTAVGRDGAFSRRVSKRFYGQYLAGGGQAGDWSAWLEWILANLPAIIAALMMIFA